MATNRRPAGVSGFMVTGGAPARRRTIEVLDRVRLTEDLTAEGVVLRKGAEGTAVFKHRANEHGEAFEVEFSSPIHAVVGVQASKLARL